MAAPVIQKPSFNLDKFTIETYDPVSSLSQKGLFIHANEQSYIKITDVDSDLKVDNLESRNLEVNNNINVVNSISGKILNMYNDGENLIYLNKNDTHEIKIKKEHILFSNDIVFNLFSSESDSKKLYIRSYTGSNDYSNNNTSNYHDIVNFYRTGSKNVVSIGTSGVINNFVNTSTGSILFISGSIYPSVNNVFEIGNASNKFAHIWGVNIHGSTVGGGDFILNNEVGSWRIVEGEDELYIYNAKKKKKYKFLLKEIDYDNYLENLEK